MGSKRFFWFLTLLVVVVIVCASFFKVTSNEPFSYDEADYMYAGTQGFWANYSDRNAMPLVEFVQKGIELARDKSQRVSMSQYVRSTGDISFYRHYHGPLYAYWIALCQWLGAQSELSYRASGLILHALGSIAIFWLFLWVFPELPVAAAFVAALMFAMNRTAIFTATMITQHVVFEFLAILALFFAARYFQTKEARWWYATAAAAGAAFAAVEISVVLAAGILAVLVIFHWKEWNILRQRFLRGLAVFTISVLVFWPKGVLELNAVKGYVYLGYMALSRRTFSPIGPAQLWGVRFTNYPFEFLVPLVVLGTIILCFRKFGSRSAIAPFLIYALVFLATTMKVTLPYTHYNGSLLASTSVLTGIAIGELWLRHSKAIRWVASLLILGSLIWMDVDYYNEARAEALRGNLAADVLRYMDGRPADKLYMPFYLVPTVHYYHPDVSTVGYDSDWDGARIAQESLASTPSIVMCVESLCKAIEESGATNAVTLRERVSQFTETRDTGETFYALSLGRP
jgi:hypothetical protein